VGHIHFEKISCSRTQGRNHGGAMVLICVHAAMMLLRSKNEYRAWLI
jgi:hypothetical protein